jgi:hypothetical protein
VEVVALPLEEVVDVEGVEEEAVVLALEEAVDVEEEEEVEEGEEVVAAVARHSFLVFALNFLHIYTYALGFTGVNHLGYLSYPWVRLHYRLNSFSHRNNNELYTSYISRQK